jgi:hypothetical protein
MKLKLLFVGLAFLLAPLMAQTVTLTNTANGALGMDFVSSDTFLVTISGAASNQTVSVYQTNNGVPTTQNPWPMGQTDANGDFSLSGTEADVNASIEYTQQWYVGGSAVGPLLDFEVIYKPAGAPMISTSVVSLTPRCPSNYTYGINVDVWYQTTNQSGFHVTTRTGIPLVPTELVSFNGGSYQSGDVGPVSGYPTSSEFADDDGSFHDVPLVSCPRNK